MGYLLRRSKLHSNEIAPAAPRDVAKRRESSQPPVPSIEGDVKSEPLPCSNLGASNIRGGDQPPNTAGVHPPSFSAFSSGREACGSANHASIWASMAIASFGPARGHILVIGPAAAATATC